MEYRGPLNALAAGAAGACVLTVLHEATRKLVPDAPRLDLLGMQSIAKPLRAAGHEPPARLRETALAGDIAANAGYYALVASAGRRRTPLMGALLGAGAGLGAALLPASLGLAPAPSGRTMQTRAMTVGLYLAGGLAAGGAYSLLSR